MRVRTFLPWLLTLLPAAASCRKTLPQPVLPPTPIAAVWAIGDGDTLERDARDAPATSPVWDGKAVKLFAAGNEIVAFQLIVRAGRPGIRQLGASLPVLAPAGNGPVLRYAPPGDDPSDFRGRDIALYTVHYMHVTRPGRADHIYTPDGPDAPADPTGWKPVQLVPENARPGRGGLPLAVAAGDNQALWFEIDAGDRPPGRYRGTVALRADQQVVNVPVELELLPFALPAAPSLTAMVYYESEQPRLYQGADLDARYHRFAHRQRIELVAGYDQPGVPPAEATPFDRFSGSDFTPQAGYAGPGQGVGNRVLPATFYGPGDGWDDRALAWKRADAWMDFVGQKFRGAITFLYLPDEPREEQFPDIVAFARRLKANPGPGGKLPLLVTHQPHPGLAGAVDIWCSTPALFDQDVAARERAAGRQHWFYNGGRPHGPALVYDAPISDARVIGWMAFKAEVPVYFYWHAVHWQHNRQKQVGPRQQNVWADPVTFDSRRADGRGEFANGDGVLLFPGTDRLHPAEDRGIAGPIGGVQLANLRRGLQDHQYLTLARQRGHGDLVARLLQTIVPRVFAQAGRQVSFPESSAPFETARMTLARALSGR
jgi:hypothetical protein